MIQFRGGVVERGPFRLGPVDLEVEGGEYHVLLGPSGAGKTTLLDLAAGVLEPSRGEVLVAARPGYLLQDHPLFPHMTVRRNVAFGLRGANGRGGNATRVAEALRLVGAEALADRMPGTLSGGEHRRVALAQVLAPAPRALLLDEPTVNLDPPLRHALLRDLKRLQGELGLAVLHVTHDFEEAFAQADRVSVLRAGGIVQTGTVEDVFRAPRDEELARFVGVENILSGLATGETFHTGRNQLDLAGAAEGTKAVLRAEDVLLATAPPETSARNVLPARIVGLEDRGATVRVTLDANGDTLRAVITRSSLDHLGLLLGSEAYAVFKAGAVRVL